MKETFAGTGTFHIKAPMRVLWFSLLFICLPLVATAEPGRLQFDGFTINGDGFKQKDIGTIAGQHPRAFLYLDVSEGFVPNVNVIVPDFSGSIGEYASLSKAEFGTTGIKVINDHISGSEWDVEYSGVLPKSTREFHWYARAILNEAKKIYLVTATATPKQWGQLSPELIKCVDSLVVTEPSQKAEVATTEPVRLQFDGFTIKGDGFQTKEVGTVMGQDVRAFLYLTVSDGFAPNVGVIVQDFGGSIGDYATLSRKQFGDAGVKIIKENTLENEWDFEYSGIEPNAARELHWYARAISNGAKIYLVTATATPSQWSQLSPKLIECVDSVVLTAEHSDQGQQPAAPLHD